MVTLDWSHCASTATLTTAATAKLRDKTFNEIKHTNTNAKSKANTKTAFAALPDGAGVPWQRVRETAAERERERERRIKTGSCVT